MKKNLCGLFCLIMLVFGVACSNNTTKAIELMGAGDRIHDTYTFANVGVKLESKGDNLYEVSGSVDAVDDENVKAEFKIDEDVSHVIAIKLTAIESEVVKDKVKVYVDGSRAYDAEHLNGSDYTFIILEAVPGSSVSIKVLWDGENELTYNINFSEKLILK